VSLAAHLVDAFNRTCNQELLPIIARLLVVLVEPELKESLA
jgi:hypothetical protein